MSDEKWGPGPEAEWSDCGSVVVNNHRHRLVHGQHPHSRRDNSLYVIMDGEPVGFEGHRPLIDVHFRSTNYLKESGLSGDEVRKSVTCQILSDREVIYEFGCRQIEYAMTKAQYLLTELSEHSSGWLMKEQRHLLVGRKIYYDRHPAVVERLIIDQGCLIIATDDGKPFPPPIYAVDDDDDRENTLKVDVLSDKIWWHRK